MAFIRLFGIVCLASTLAGCRPASKGDSPASPVPNDKIQAMRQSFQAVNPNTRVGVVVTDPIVEEHLVAVGEIEVKDFKVGDVVLFYDINETLINRGKVVYIVSDALHVKYDAPGEGQRAPAKGDVAIRVIK